MIANGNMEEGVQLLVMAGRAGDACKYLQSYDRWADAAWLAKVSLPEEEALLVFRRWANHLVGIKQTMKAIQIFLSLGEFQQVLILLKEAKEYELACLFSQFCVEFGFLNENGEVKRKNKNKFQNSEEVFSVPMDKLSLQINMEYGYEFVF
jgi:hypothetical protein